MTPRVPFLVAVVGALLIGGAGAGGTHAKWVDQKQLQQADVSSGSMSFATTQPAGVTMAAVVGTSATTSFVLDDTSVGKKLQQRVTTSVTSTPTGVTATVGTSCPGAASVQVDSTPTTPDVTLCVRVTSSLTAVSGNVVLSLSGAQRPSGWTTPVTTVTVPVTIGTAPAAPTPVCAANGQSFSWAAVGGATQYVVSSSSAQTSGYSDVSTQTSLSYTPAVSGQSTTYFRVKATNTIGTSGNNGTVRIIRSGSSYTCTVVTP